MRYWLVILVTTGVYLGDIWMIALLTYSYSTQQNAALMIVQLSTTVLRTRASGGRRPC